MPLEYEARRRLEFARQSLRRTDCHGFDKDGGGFRPGGKLAPPAPPPGNLNTKMQKCYSEVEAAPAKTAPEMERASMERGLAAIKTVCNRCTGFPVKKKCPRRTKEPCPEMQRDLVDAFRHIPVAPEDYWLLGFMG